MNEKLDSRYHMKGIKVCFYYYSFFFLFFYKNGLFVPPNSMYTFVVEGFAQRMIYLANKI